MHGSPPRSARAELRRRNELVPEATPHGGGIALDRRETGVHLARLEPRDRGLRRMHPSGDRSLRDPGALALRSERAEKVPSIEGSLHQLREDRVAGGAVGDDLLEKIGVRASTGTLETPATTLLHDIHFDQLYLYRYSQISRDRRLAIR